MYLTDGPSLTLLREWDCTAFRMAGQARMRDGQSAEDNKQNICLLYTWNES